MTPLKVVHVRLLLQNINVVSTPQAECVACDVAREAGLFSAAIQSCMSPWYYNIGMHGDGTCRSYQYSTVHTVGSLALKKLRFGRVVNCSNPCRQFEAEDLSLPTGQCGRLKINTAVYHSTASTAIMLRLLQHTQVPPLFIVPLSPAVVFIQISTTVCIIAPPHKVLHTLRMLEYPLVLRNI